MFERIKEIVETVIGQPRRESDGWLEYNCPYCSQEKGVDNDGKYNLALNYGSDGITKPFFHCWRCEESGKISKLLKDFGNKETLSSYYNELQNIKSSLEYQLDFETNDNKAIKLENGIELPTDFRPIKADDFYAKEALQYLQSRNINWDIIKRFNIGYVPYWSKDKQMHSRIVIPSYDKYGDLNYFVARDYTGKRKYRKYNNPLVEKTHFVFNEEKINWYEDITLVEGAFDHIVVPNSIPLLGKSLKSEYATFNAIVNNAMANINVFLDDDALVSAKKIYRLLETTSLKGKIRLIECPTGYDASDIYKVFGRKGIIQMLSKARKLTEFEKSIKV